MAKDEIDKLVDDVIDSASIEADEMNWDEAEATGSASFLDQGAVVHVRLHVIAKNGPRQDDGWCRFKEARLRFEFRVCDQPPISMSGWAEAGYSATGMVARWWADALRFAPPEFLGALYAAQEAAEIRLCVDVSPVAEAEKIFPLATAASKRL